MSDVAAYLAAAVLLAFAAYRSVTDRRVTPYPSQLAVYGFVVCEGVTMALLAPATSDLLARLGVGSFEVVLAGDQVRTAAVSFLMLLGCALSPRPDGAASRAHRLAMPAVLVAFAVQALMIATFLGAGARMTPDAALEVRGAGRWLLSVHDAAFALYAIWCLAVIAGALGREARRVGPGPLRLGLRLTLAAAGVGILWTAWTVDDIVDVLRTGVQDGSEDVVSNVLGAVCASLVVAGTTVSKWGEAMAAPLRWLRSYRMYTRLGPLWEALRTELPQIALADRRRGLGAVLPSSTEFALYRRVIEIHDGRLALRPYAQTPATVAESVRRLAAAGRADGARVTDPGEAADEAALIEAASIAVALANLRAGRRLEDPEACEAREALSDAAGTSGTVDAEAAWLLRVTEAFAGSPIVPRVLELLAASPR